MTALVLTLWLCAGDHCQRVERPWQGSAIECALYGQQAAAAIIAAEYPPGTTLRRYRCGPPEDDA